MSKLQNLSVPFNIPIPGGMRNGKMIIVQGNIPSMSQRFAVNLLTSSGDIALHVCPKFKENRVVRNNVLNMNWGPEESSGSMPVFPGQSFEILILCEPYSFKVAFNGRHFCEFSHRLPFNTITNLAVDGEVVIYKINFNDPSGYENNNNEVSNSVPYGFQADIPSNNHSSGHLYPSVDSYPYPSVPSVRRSPSPSVPNYPTSGGAKYPNPSGSLYPRPDAPQYPNTPAYPSTGGSAYPTQPGYPSVPHQGPYPQVPSPNLNGGTSSVRHQPGLLDQAGAALAGIIGPTLLAGSMNRNSAGDGKRNVLDDPGKALASVIGGAGLAAVCKAMKGTQPSNPTQQSGFLAGIFGDSGLMGATGRTSRGVMPQTPTRGTQPHSILDDAGSAVAEILGSGGLSGETGRSQRGVTPATSTRHHGSFLDDAGSALAGILGGGGLSGATGRSQRGVTPATSTRHHGSILDDAGSALAGILGGGGLSGGHHNRNKLGVLGGALGTAVAGAALTGHLNPIKATKKQLKAQKKSLKYGLPIAGVGLGAYALHKGLKKGFRRSSSSSSCSSSD